MNKRALLIDADLLDNGTRHPNLALMKISGYLKKKGYEVKLLTDYNNLSHSDYDEIYISKVFTFTNYPPILDSIPDEKKQKGGTGFFPDGNSEDLKDEIEHHMPDYNLYDEYIDIKTKSGRSKKYFSDYLDYSIGFTTRGCFRKCPFCVNKKYDKVIRHSPVSEFLDPDRKRIYLWDDNILAYEKWYEIFDELNQTGKPFQFRQGLDIRLFTKEKAKVLAYSKYWGDIIFAFDNIDEKDHIIRKLELWKKYSDRQTKFFLLTGYYRQDEKDIEETFERIKILMHYQCLPYIMRHENYLNSEFRSLYIQLARWCNQPNIFKKMSFRQFCEANQKYHEKAKNNKKTLCSSYDVMVKLEEAFPSIAKKYFDIRYGSGGEL